MVMNLLIVLYFLTGVFVFIMKRKHLIMTLLSLEYMILILYFGILLYLMGVKTESFFLMMFLVCSVCEGALGLSVLISMIRTHGNDLFQSYVMLRC